MEAEVVERRENPLLAREEVLLKIRAQQTPSRKEVRELVVAKLGASPESVIVKKIWGLSGSREFNAEVFIYKDLEVMRTIEPEYVLKRNEVIEDEAQAE